MKMLRFLVIVLSVIAITSCDRTTGPAAGTTVGNASNAEAEQEFSITEVVPGKFVDADYNVGSDGTNFKVADRLFIQTKANRIVQGDAFDGSIKDSSGAILKTSSNIASATGNTSVNLDFGMISDIGLKSGIYTVVIAAKGVQKSTEITVE